MDKTSVPFGKKTQRNGACLFYHNIFRAFMFAYVVNYAAAVLSSVMIVFFFVAGKKHAHAMAYCVFTFRWRFKAEPIIAFYRFQSLPSAQ